MPQKTKPAAPRIDSSGGYEEIPHTADLALRVWGEDLKALFVNAARGMTALMSDPATAVSPVMTHPLELAAMDSEGLIVEWLSEIAFLAESKGALFQVFSITDISETGLKAVLEGRPAGELKRIIKAVTYHNLKIIQTARGMEATVVFDV